ncbi:hypothetical protein GW17_00062482 [Ensete ventricosum]|nr:hypothetical protein GW17_00062482 [Ensete ventricosum]
MNDTINIFDLGSSLTVTRRVVVPTRAIESPVNPVNVDVTGRRLPTLATTFVGRCLLVWDILVEVFCRIRTEKVGAPSRTPELPTRGVHRAFLGPRLQIFQRTEQGAHHFLCLKPRSDATVGFGWELVIKLSSNSFARESKEEMDDDLSRLYHILAGPLRVVGKARHISGSDVSYRVIWPGRPQRVPTDLSCRHNAPAPIVKNQAGPARPIFRGK